MKRTLDNTALWNEAAKAGAYLGGVSVVCLSLKELAAVSDIDFLIKAASIILWVVEFLGCILLMKDLMLSMRDRYEDVKITDTFRMGRRAALLSGLLLASAEALFVMKAPEAKISDLVDLMAANFNGVMNRDEIENVVDRLPLVVFFSQWIYCFLYGTVLASVMSRYIYLQKLFGGNFPPRGNDTPDEQ